MTPQNKNAMHPDDKRNLIVFFLCCIGLFLAYDIFIYKPHVNAIKEAQERQAALEAEGKIAPNALSQGADSVHSLAVLEVDAALARSPRLAIESDTLDGSIALKGGRFDHLNLKNYYETTAREKEVMLLAPARTAFPKYADFGWVSADDNIAAADLPSTDSVWRLQSNTGALNANNSVTLTWNNGKGLRFEREIALDDHYMFTIKDRVFNESGQAVTLFPYAMVSRKGLPMDVSKSAIMHEGPTAYLDNEYYEASFTNLADGDDIINVKARSGWIGISEKYWLSAIVPPQDASARYRIDSFLNDGDAALDKQMRQRAARYKVDYTASALTAEANGSIEHITRFYAGPKIVNLLEQYEEEYNIPHFDLAVDFGIFYFMTRPFFAILNWIGNTIGSFALAILIFTVMLRLAVFPLANKSFRSFARMRKLTPKMIELREKYGDDRQRLQKAIFELYQKEKVNPMAGCLPILIQIPIFFALYKVLFITIEMRHTPFWGWINDMSAMDPTSLFNLFGLIPWDPPAMLMIGAWPCIMCVTLLLQQRLNPPPQDPIQAKMISFMPFVITFILAKFPAGLVIYWTWSNFLSIIQQYVLMRQEGVEINLFKRSKDEEKLEDMVEHGPSGVSPSIEMIEEEVEELVDHNEASQSPAKKSPTKTRKKGKKTSAQASKQEAATEPKKTETKKKAPAKKTAAKTKTDAKKAATKKTPVKKTPVKKTTAKAPSKSTPKEKS
jgi:YidC/Oxa1 family membrane protein insertase